MGVSLCLEHLRERKKAYRLSNKKKKRGVSRFITTETGNSDEPISLREAYASPEKREAKGKKKTLRFATKSLNRDEA